MERKSKGTIDPNATVKKPNWFQFGEKIKVARKNKKSRKKYGQ